MLKYMMNYLIKAIVSSILTFSSNRSVEGSSPSGAAFRHPSKGQIKQIEVILKGNKGEYMPCVAAGLSRWPFKPEYRVQLPDRVPCLLDVVGKKETSQLLTRI